ncbi:MAG: glycerophosphodiester phosphodiesterase, partial [Parvularculaceae bacterium]|nr:glycerophosphodiester phosphodiesterase [Parvularculaceae bacterium]
KTWRSLRTDIPAATRAEAKACIKGYIAWGWLGHLPQACRGGVGVPLNLRRAYWGWPNRLQARFPMTDGGVLLVGHVGGKGSASYNIDNLEELDQIPEDFAGWIATDKIEVIGPALAERR